MAVELTMPQLGESVHEGTVGRWLKVVGDRLQRFEALLEVESDKINTEIPAPISGHLTQIVTPAGTTVAVGTVLALIEPLESAAGGPVANAVEAAGESAALGTVETTTAVALAPRQPRRFTPVVLKMAAEQQVDLSPIAGSGHGGRVTKHDLLSFLEARSAGPAPRPTETAVAQATGFGPRDERLPLSAVRRQIAEKLSRSTTEIPHAGGMIEVDMTDLVALRESLRDEFLRREHIALTFLPFAVKATAAALRQFPVLNSQWGGDCIILKHEINVAIAVALEDSLLVPVIHRVDGLSVAGIARAAADIAERARAGRLRLEDVQDGTFTLNNTGALGTTQSRPIINHPQAAILTTEAIVQRAVVLPGGAFAARWMMNMCISFDHRIMDGLVVSEFLKAVREHLEHPAQLGLY